MHTYVHTYIHTHTLTHTDNVFIATALGMQLLFEILKSTHPPQLWSTQGLVVAATREAEAASVLCGAALCSATSTCCVRRQGTGETEVVKSKQNVG